MNSRSRLTSKSWTSTRRRTTSGTSPSTSSTPYCPPDQISLELLSSLFEVSIRVYSVTPQNRIPFSSSINCMYTRKIELLSSSAEDALLYAALFEEPFPECARQLRAAACDDSLPLVDRAIASAGDAAEKELYTLMKAEADFNLLVLQKLKEKFKLVTRADPEDRFGNEAAASRESQKLQENEKTEVIESIVSTYEGCICKYLNLASLMDFHMKKLTKTEVGSSHPGRTELSTENAGSSVPPIRQKRKG